MEGRVWFPFSKFKKHFEINHIKIMEGRVQAPESSKIKEKGN